MSQVETLTAQYIESLQARITINEEGVCSGISSITTQSLEQLIGFTSMESDMNIAPLMITDCSQVMIRLENERKHQEEAQCMLDELQDMEV